jgi:hypothetical protein
MLHLDLTKNPFPFSLTPSTNYSAYLFIVVTPGKLVGWVGLLGESSRDIYEGLKKWLLETQLRGRINRVQVIRADAGSAFVSPWFSERCNRELNIKIEAAAPHHQEQNGMCEAKWKELHATANTLLNNARLGGAFFHHAHMYAAEIINRIPARGVVDEYNLPTTPYYVCFKKKPSLTNFRVFGCPTFFKRYEPTSGGKKVTRPQQIQRASRGIFVGFPHNSAGWLIYSAETKPSKLTISYDVHFDEHFHSALSFDSKPFAGSVPIRTFSDPSEVEDNPSGLTQPPSSQTGSIADLGIPSTSFIDHNNSSSTAPVEEGRNDEETQNTNVPSTNEGSTPNTAEEALLKIEDDYYECNEPSPRECPVSISMLDTSSQNEPIYKYLPEPQSLKAVMRCDPNVQRAWMHAIHMEIKNLIDHGTFIIGEEPNLKELIIRVKLVLKAKQTSTGDLEKLKARLVARGDMEKRRMKQQAQASRIATEKQRSEDKQHRALGQATPAPIPLSEPPEDTWSPTATSRGVKLFLAIAAACGCQAKSADIIGAYLRAKVVGRHFVQLPFEYAELFPQYKQYFGVVPLLLAKGMYGLVYSGKFWNIEYSEWLVYSRGFVQSASDPSFFVYLGRNMVNG